MPANRGIKTEWYEIIAASVQKTPFYELLGIELEEIGSGWAVLGVETHNKHTNPLAIVHGGLVTSLGDAAMGNAIRSLGKKAVTANMNIEFMRSIALEAKLTARGEVVKAGANLIFARAAMECNNQLVATTSGTFYVIGDLD